MKKIFALLMAVTMLVSLAACGGTQSSAPATEPSSESAAEPSSESAPEESAPAEGGNLKTGLGVSNALTVEEGKAEINSVVAVVLVDSEGKIADCRIDEAQTKATIENGAVVEPEDLRTKEEKQGDYGMAGASPIGKEWFEQAEFFANYVIGKTVDEVSAIELTDNYPTEGTDLAAGCTIHANRFVEAVVEAVNNATDIGAKVGDVLGLAVTTSKYYKSDATNLQYDSDIAVVTVGPDGKVTSCIVDAAQGKLPMADGKFTGETGTYLSKKELKEDYGMAGASPIGAEWYTQAAAYEAYVTGKTADEISAIELTDGAATEGTDLAAGCTITVTSIIANTVKAIGNAK